MKINMGSKTVRFSDAPWYETRGAFNLVMGGAGGIGSWTAVMLAKSGFNICLYDMDTVDTLNLGPQMFPQRAVNVNKSLALNDFVNNYLKAEGFIHARDRYNEGSEISPIMIAAFDNMAARKLMYTEWKKGLSEHSEELAKYALFLDGRMLAEQFQVLFVNPYRTGDFDRYEALLFDDKEVSDGPCSFKSTVHFGAGIAYNICKGLTNHLTNVAKGMNLYEVPFRIEEYGPAFLTTIE